MAITKHPNARMAEWRRNGREEPFEAVRTLNESKGSVQTTLPAVAFDLYDETLPDSVVMEYNPVAHNLRIDLPEPQNNTTEGE